MFFAQGHVQCWDDSSSRCQQALGVVACTIRANPTEVTLFSTGVLIVVKQRFRQLPALLTRRLEPTAA